MRVVAEAQRLETLRRLGLSEALVRHASGERLHPLLELRCRVPPFYTYHGADCPDGPPLAPLWDCFGFTTGVWTRDGRLEFIRFSVEEPEKYTVLAHTEQGLWATVFVDLYEDEDQLGPEDFRDAARAVGFRLLDRVVAAYGRGFPTFEAHKEFLRDLVATIDGESAAT